MDRSYNIFIAIILFATVSFSGTAQTFTGRVYCKELPVEFLNVLLFSSDSTMLTGATTDSLGRYSIEYSNIGSNTKQNPSYLQFSSLQYKSKIVSIDSIEHTDALIEVVENIKELDAIVVVGKQPIYKMSNGTFITNVSSSPALKNSGSIDNLLNKIPFVYGKNGSYEVLGAGNAEIYLNKQKVQDPSILQSLRSQDIKTVEILKNPGAKYASDVNAVIIINTQKNDRKSALSITQLLQQQNKLSSYTGINLNHANGPTDLNLNIAYSNTNMETQSNDKIQVFDKLNPSETNDDANINYHSDYIRMGLGMNSELGKKANIGFTTNLNMGLMNNEVLSNGLKHFQGNSATFDSPTNANSIVKPLKSTTNLYYSGKIKTTSINITDNFLLGRNYNTFEYAEKLNNVSVATDGKQKFLMNSLLISFNSPCTEGGNLEYGIELTHSINNNIFSYSQEQIETEMENSEINHTQTLYAGYLAYRYNVKSFSIYGGLRYTYEIPAYKENNISIKKGQYSPSVFSPSLSISYDKENINAELSYRRTLSKPSYSSLNNFIVYESRYTYQQGNPLLDNQIKDMYSFNGMHKNFKLSFTYNAYKNSITSMLFPFKIEDGIVLRRLTNIPKYSDASLGLNWGTTYNRYSPTIQIAGGKQWLKYSHETFNSPFILISSDNYFKLEKQWGLNLYCAYTSSKYELYARISHQWEYSISLTKQKNNFNINFNINNLFLPRFLSEEKKMNNISAFERVTQDFSGISLTVSYRLNSIKPRYNNRKASDELQRF
ncbi:MAG: outer membrane beta-barrel family protein [Candidatus Symbiothrix sp.]|jgi:hypothetical protein|nr:outer membrane beta-barrel family protein [Candidatus Symbiothrix sp.]